MNHPKLSCNHISQKQLADYWGISQCTPERWRVIGLGAALPENRWSCRLPGRRHPGLRRTTSGRVNPIAGLQQIGANPKGSTSKFLFDAPWQYHQQLLAAQLIRQQNASTVKQPPGLAGQFLLLCHVSWMHFSRRL